MRKNPNSSMMIGVALVILIAIFSYFGYQLYRQEKRMTNIRTVVVEDSNKIATVVNFINQSLANAQANANQ